MERTIKSVALWERCLLAEPATSINTVCWHCSIYSCSFQHRPSSPAESTFSTTELRSAQVFMNMELARHSRSGIGRTTHLSGMLLHRLFILQALLHRIRFWNVGTLFQRWTSPHPLLPLLQGRELLDVDACPASCGDPAHEKCVSKLDGSKYS